MLTGRQPLINDGYLVLNPTCLDSLHDEHSPLRVLLRQGYVGMLSRNAERSLEQVVVKGAEQGIETYRKLLRDTSRWPEVQRMLNGVGPSQIATQVDWPNLNLTSSFKGLVERLAAKTPQEVGLTKVSALIWNRMSNDFLTEVATEATRPRDRWEQLAKRHARSQAQIDQMMRLANEIYHYSFAIGLTARPPTPLQGCAVAVQTRLSPSLSGFDQEFSLGAGASLSQKHFVQVPDGIPYADGHLVEPPLSSSETVGKARTDYLQQRARYVSNQGDEKDLVDATAAYQAALDAYLEKRTSNRVSTRAGSAAIATGAFVAGLYTTAPVLGPFAVPVSAGVALVAYVGSDFLVPIATERWRVDFKVHKWLRRLRGTPADKKLMKRQAITTFRIDAAQALELTRELPALR